MDLNVDLGKLFPLNHEVSLVQLVREGIFLKG